MPAAPTPTLTSGDEITWRLTAPHRFLPVGDHTATVSLTGEQFRAQTPDASPLIILWPVHNWAVFHYLSRCATDASLSIAWDEVVYVHVGGLGHLVALTEITPAAEARP